jgi:predicted enzyme related to lactoylglutathione lyase
MRFYYHNPASPLCDFIENFWRYDGYESPPLRERILPSGTFEPFGPGGAAQPMPDGRRPAPGGWNRIIINVDDLPAEVARLKQAQLHFRNDIVKGPGGSEILLDDPSGNPVELFQPAP